MSPPPRRRTSLPQREVGELGGAQETTSFLGVLMASRGHGDSEGSWTRPRSTSSTGTRRPFAGDRNTQRTGLSVARSCFPLRINPLVSPSRRSYFHRVGCRLSTWQLLRQVKDPFMGHNSVVFGCILASEEAGILLEMHECNLATIAALPATSRDDVYPPLTRDMFSVPPETPGYNAVVTTFGASYNHVETAWPAWLAKFEGLLRRLYWDSVEVYLRTELVGNHHYHWRILSPRPPRDGDEAMTDDLPLWGRRRWAFSGGPRDFTETLRPRQPWLSCDTNEP